MLLAACGGGSGVGRSVGTGQAPPQATTVQGVAYAGSAVLNGASLTVYAAASAAETPQILGQATTDANGAFELSVRCSSGAANAQQIYLVVAGGQTQASRNGNATNSAVRLVATLGDCTRLPTMLTVNELTTVAAAYALSAFIQDTSIAGSAPGLANAIATAASLVNPATGGIATSLPSPDICLSTTPQANCEAVEKVNTLANALAACVTSSSSSSPACTALFSCAMPGASDGGSGACTPPPSATAPSDTWQAVTMIARSPGLTSASGLYRAAGASAAYAPMAPSAPADWALSLTYSGGGLSEPTALAIDAEGNVWVANYNNAVSEFSPTGAALSPAAGFSGGGLEESFGIAIDAVGHVWVCNEQSPGAVNSASGSITELGSDGTVLSGASGYTGGGLDFPEALMVDAGGNIWIANYGNSTLTELSSDGAPLSPVSGFSGGGLSFPVGIAADAQGNFWIADQGANQISAFSSVGAPLSPSTGYRGGGLTAPQGIIVDQQNNIWVSNYYSNSVSQFNHLGVALSPATGYVGAGLTRPGGIAIDGAGQVWVANFDGGSISELSGSGAAVPGSSLSPPNGFANRSLLQPFAVAIDASGNLWVSNFGNDTVTEFIGIAGPVATPLIGGPRSP